MKKYNYENLKEDAHVYHMWEPLKFEIKDNYKYIPKNILFVILSNILSIIVNFLLVIINKVLFGYKIINRNKREKKGTIIISNHIHPMDCTMISLIYAPSRVYYPTLQSNLKIPFIRHLIRILYAVPIPNKENQKVKFYNEINEALKDGKVIQMYPEGSMWPYYESIRSFKYGAFKMAVDANKGITLVRFIFTSRKGIYKLYKRKKCINAVVLGVEYPNLSLSYNERIEELRNRCFEIMKGDL